MTDSIIQVEKTSLGNYPIATSSLAYRAVYFLQGYPVRRPVAGPTTDAAGCTFNSAAPAPSQIDSVPGLGKLRKPIKVSVEKESGRCFFITAEDLDITESGSTLGEAIDAFLT